ncbi:MAG: histidine kinase [Lachnospiraceae bacterium]|nr:histidine kinase [Lachnospiraceae bacterium]
MQNSLRSIRQRFDALKLNVRFTLMIILFIAVPIGIFAGFLFWTMEQAVIQEGLSKLEYEMERQKAQIRKNVESINMSTQFFLSNQALLEYLVKVKQGKTIPVQELNAFYHNDIASMERMINSNLYLYQIRVYAEGDNLKEMMPVLYSRSRMERLAWAQDEVITGWKFHYADTIFDSYANAQNNKLVSLVTRIEDYEYGELGILEAAMSMETMFEGMYDGNAEMITCFMDEKGSFYYGEEQDRDNLLMRTTLEDMAQDAYAETYYHTVINRKDVIVGCLAVKELSGTLVCVQDISGNVGRIRHMRNLFVLLAVALIPLLVLGINAVVKTVLQQLYRILGAIKEVQAGNLDVVIENCGMDEMGELGSQFNKMLSEIKRLMEDNLKRELLAKNSEIKALQNQINAHFIYNVLESIKMMAEIEEKYEISDAITTFGKLLRYSMRWNSGNVTVEQEVDYIRNYLKLINLRFDYEIYLSLNIPDIVYQQQIPKMSLQPIVENAIYHGIEQMAEDTNIYIKGIADGKDCMIEITDAGKGMSEEEVVQLYRKIAGEIEASGGSGNGIGLKNVQDRIKMSFGDAYGIEIASKLGCYTKIVVRVPLTGTASIRQQ